MTKKVFFLLLGLFLTTTAVKAGENDDETPKNEISVSYGIPYTSVVNEFANIFSTMIIAGFTGDVKYHGKESWGGINVDYNYHVLPWLALGANASYSSIEGDITQGSKTGKDKETYITLMANVKMDWYRRKHVTLYSRFSAGVLFENNEVTSGTTSESKGTTMFMGQLSPFGFEVGSKNIRYFSELGFGQAGICQGGIRVRF